MNKVETSKSYHHGNLREALLDTAIERLREGGADNLSLRALARGIGVSQTAPYRHFEDKSELLAAMATNGYRDLLRALREAGDTAGDCPREQLFAFAHALIRSSLMATPPEEVVKGMSVGAARTPPVVARSSGPGTMLATRPACLRLSTTASNSELPSVPPATFT